MPTFNFYSVWMDPVFYLWGLAAAAALFGLVYSIRRYVELKNESPFGEEPGASDVADLPSVAEDPALPVADAAPAQPELPISEPPRREAPAPAPEPAPAPAAHPAAGISPAENFVRGIYEGISGLDSRLKAIESHISKSKVNSDFTVTFLEDIVQDFDSLDKQKIKARLEYLISDLKK